MKRKALEKSMKKLGWYFHREGADHAIWTNGQNQIPVPRHREIGEGLSKKILKQARLNPPEK